MLLTRRESVEEEEKNKAVRRKGSWLKAHSCFMQKLHNCGENGGLVMHFIDYFAHPRQYGLNIFLHHLMHHQKELQQLHLSCTEKFPLTQKKERKVLLL